MDDYGQMQVMEVMIAALLFMVAVQAAVDVSRPSSEQQSLNQLRTLGNDSLLALDNKPCEDSIYYNSSLIKYTMTDFILERGNPNLRTLRQ